MTENKYPSNLPADELALLSAQAKRHLEDNPLLEALTLVIESNAEYARGVTTILDADLEREVLLNEIKKDLIVIKRLVEKNNEDITYFNSQIMIVLSRLEKFDSTLAEQLKEKLKPLYVAADLQDSGAAYNPTDKLVVTSQKVLSSKLFTMIAGIVIWIIAKFIFEGMK